MKKLLLFLGLCFSLYAQGQTLRYFKFTNRCGNNEWRDTSFVVATNDAAVIQLVEAQLALPKGSRNRFISGKLVADSVSYNKNAAYTFPWHIAENDWTLVEFAIELCDGCPYTDISLNLNYWVNTVKRYCGWSTRVDRELFFDTPDCKPSCVPIVSVKIIAPK